jgi:hypothetical protein
MRSLLTSNRDILGCGLGRNWVIQWMLPSERRKKERLRRRLRETFLWLPFQNWNTSSRKVVLRSKLAPNQGSVNLLDDWRGTIGWGCVGLNGYIRCEAFPWLRFCFAQIGFAIRSSLCIFCYCRINWTQFRNNPPVLIPIVLPFIYLQVCKTLPMLSCSLRERQTLCSEA